MNPQIQHCIQQVRMRLKAVVWAHGICSFVAVFVGLTCAIGLMDWWLHFSDSGTRLLLSSAACVTVCGVLWRFLIVPLRLRFSDVDVAMQIERHVDGFHDRLSSLVEFSERRFDAEVGSPELQRSLAEQTLTKLQSVSPSAVVSSKPVKPVATVALATVLLLCCFVTADQSSVSTAAQRMFLPLRDIPWPKTTKLLLINAEFAPLEIASAQPLRVAHGSDIEFFVVNTKGRLPKSVVFHKLYPSGRIELQELRRTSLRDTDGETREVAFVDFVAKSDLSFWVVGGDDADMEHYRVEVVPPPLITRLNVTVLPPSYTGNPSRQNPEGVGHVKALVHSKVSISGRVNKPLRSCVLTVGSDSDQSLELADDELGFKGEFKISKPGNDSYRLTFEDHDGFSSGNQFRFEIRATDDQAPVVEFSEPTGDVLVTREAQLRVRVSAEDDLGLASHQFLHHDIDAEPNTATSRSLMPLDGVRGPTRNSAELVWDLSPLDLKPGQRVEFWSEAQDAFDQGEPHVGKSLTRSIIVVTKSDKLNEIADRQTLILEDLNRVHEDQKSSHERIGELLVQLKNTGSLRDTDMQDFRRVESSQRQNWDRLFEGESAVLGRVRELVDELKLNGIQHAPTDERLKALGEELLALQSKTLPKLEADFATAKRQLLGESDPPGESHRPGANPPESAESGRGQTGENPTDGRTKKTESPDARDPDGADVVETREPPAVRPDLSKPANPAEVEQPNAKNSPTRWPSTKAEQSAKSLTDLRQDQAVAIDALDAMVALLSKWQRQHDLTGDLESLISGQTELHEQSVDMRNKTVGQELRNLSPQQRADLEKLADRQSRHADRLSDWEGKLEDVLRKLDSDSPLAGSIDDALAELRQRALSGRVQETADNIRRNRIGQATDQQSQLLKEFRELDEILANRGVSDTETLVKKLKKAEDELETLHKRQDDVLQQSARANGEASPALRDETLRRLHREQQQIRADTNRQARELRRLRANRSAQALRRAESRMQSSETELAGGAPDRATADQQESLDDLEQAQRETALERRDAEERLAREMIDRMDGQLASMVTRQESLIVETKRLIAEQTADGRWNRKQLKMLRDHAKAQDALQVDTRQLSDAIKTARVFSLALKTAARWMSQAEQRIADRKVDEDTIAAQEAAKARLKELVAALGESRQPPSQPRVTGAEAAGQPRQQGGIGASLVTQLKLLRSLQEDVKQSTARLDAANDGDAQEKLTKQASLAEQQGELAALLQDLLFSITRPASPAGN